MKETQYEVIEKHFEHVRECTFRAYDGTYGIRDIEALVEKTEKQVDKYHSNIYDLVRDVWETLDEDRDTHINAINNLVNYVSLEND